jgi:hypothetical protein
MAYPVHEPLKMQRKNIYELAYQHAKEQQQNPERYPAHIYVLLLNSLIAAYFLFECNEALEETSVYRQKLKQTLKQLKPILEDMVNEDLGLLMNTAENVHVLSNLNDGFKNFVENLHLRKLSKHTPANLAGLGELLAQFHQMPELVLHRNGIKIKEYEHPH